MAREDKVVVAAPNLKYPGLYRIPTPTRELYAVDDFLSHAECDEIIEASRPVLQRSQVVTSKSDRDTGKDRTSSSAFLSRDDLWWVTTRVAALTNKPISHQEPPQVAHYHPGQFFRPHYDALDVDLKTGLADVRAHGGQRCQTVLIYLSDSPSGGGTYFPELDLRIQPKKGRMVLFFPTDVNGARDSMALHSGEDASTEKWLFQIWVRQGDF